MLSTLDTTEGVWIGGREVDSTEQNSIWVRDISETRVNDTLWDKSHSPPQPDNHGGVQDHIRLYQGDGFDDEDQLNEYIFLCETEYLLC